MSDEKKLIKKAQNQNREAFGALYDVYMDRIYRFIFLRVSKKSDAEDITQKVFIKAWQNIDRYKIRKNIPFSSWLYRIAKNTVIDYYRTEKNHSAIDDIPEHEVSEEGKDHEKAADDILKFNQIKEALNKLTDNQQDIIIMKFVEELENEEIAEILDKTEVAIRVTQHRALKKLRKIIKKEQKDS